MSTPTFILGGSGYVAGELLRLVAAHPHLESAAILSDSQPGELVAKAFPHLAAILGEQRFVTEADLLARVAATPQSAVFGAAPHGVSAALVDRVLAAAETRGARVSLVDISADYRYPTGDAYAAVYDHAHGAPHRLSSFTCAVPEHLAKPSTPHVAHPGCFATATLLASVPLLALGLIEPMLFVSGVTGSTGSGRKPVEGTHHPLRHGDLYSYNALAHRHAPEITACAAAASGVQAHFAFVPHSGPFARGIHVTVQARMAPGIALDTPELLEALRRFYADSPFVRITDSAPRMKDVVTSNYVHMSGSARAGTLVVMAVIDNLTKGAAGGAVQWMNRLLGWPETCGLLAPAPGWS